MSRNNIIMNIGTIKSKLYTLSKKFNDSVFYYLHKKPKVLDNYETIDRIVNNKCSIARFGDGEFYLLMREKEFDFQKKDEKLSQRLEEILTSNNENNILIGIPKVFNKKDLRFRTDESKNWWSNYMLNNRRKWYKYLNLNKEYGSSTFTRNYIAVKDKDICRQYYTYVKSIWKNRNIVIIEGNYSRIGAGNDLFSNSKSIERILCPNKNAFDKYEDILNKVKNNIPKDKLILIALGPTATVLAYDLAKIGYQAIDLGHIDIEYEWLLRGVDKKIAIDNKYTFEAGNIDISSIYNDKEYNEQIKFIIK